VAASTGVGLAWQTLDDIIEVARDLIKEVGGQEQEVRGLRDVDKGLRSVATSKDPKRSSAARALRRELTSEEAINRRAQEVRRELDRLLNKVQGKASTGSDLKRGLRDVIRRGSADAARAEELIDEWGGSAVAPTATDGGQGRRTTMAPGRGLPPPRWART
jgi:vacuolar-type H+-ATPase subunit I/STV1